MGVNQARHVLDDTGWRVTREDCQSLGLKAAPNDMDWSVNAAGPVEAKVLRQCDASALRLREYATAMSGRQLKVDTDSRAIHIAVVTLGSQIFKADAKGWHGAGM